LFDYGISKESTLHLVLRFARPKDKEMSGREDFREYYGANERKIELILPDTSSETILVKSTTKTRTVKDCALSIMIDHRTRPTMRIARIIPAASWLETIKMTSLKQIAALKSEPEDTEQALTILQAKKRAREAAMEKSSNEEHQAERPGKQARY
jgi:hypothetical protein